MNMKTENWNGHEIRFIEFKGNNWWAVASDIAKALNYSKVESMLRKVRVDSKGAHLMSTPGGKYAY